MIVLVLPLLNAAAGVVQLAIRREDESIPHRFLKRDVGSNNSQNVHEIDLHNSISYYKTDLLIGNPPQRVAVQIDTGSSDLWVISSTNPFCQTSNTACSWSSTFDSERSQSFQPNRTKPFGITYGDTTFASGYFAQDDIILGGSSTGSESSFGPQQSPQSRRNQWGKRDLSNQFVIKSANFALAERANSSEAVWGIGMESTESIAKHLDSNGNVYPTYPNVPIQMKQQGLIETVSYSLWLNNLQSSSGSVLFGGVDHNRYDGVLQTVPLVNTYRGVSKPLDFSVVMHGISVYNGQNEEANVVECSIPVLLDSGTTYTQLPMPILHPIAQALGAYYDKKNSMFLVDANRHKQLRHGGLSFNLSGVIINVPMEELLIPVTPMKSRNDSDDEISSDDSTKSEKSLNGVFNRPEEIYVLGMLPMDASAKTAYILGDTFLRSAYVVYDLERYEIGLANALHNTNDTNIEAINSSGIPRASQAPQYSMTELQTRFTTYSVTDLFNSQVLHSTVSTVMTGYESLPGMATHSVSDSGAVEAATTKTTKRHHNGASRVRKMPFALLCFAFVVAHYL